VPIVLTTSVSADYFRVVRIPMQKGRSFRRTDNANAPLVVMIDSTAARRFWPNEQPIRKRIMLEQHGPARTVVGVVGAVEHNALVTAAIGVFGEVYTPLAQTPKPGLSLVVRAYTDPATIIPQFVGSSQI
jgi:hypothetical protein